MQTTITWYRAGSESNNLPPDYNNVLAINSHGYVLDELVFRWRDKWWSARTGVCITDITHWGHFPKHVQVQG